MESEKIYIDENNTLEIKIINENGTLVPKAILPEDKKNDRSLIYYANNLNKILKLTQSDGVTPITVTESSSVIDAQIMLGKMKISGITGYQKFGNLNFVTNSYTPLQKLTTFEQKMLSQGNIEKIEQLDIPFTRDVNMERTAKTDLHTHFTAVLSADKMIEIGLKNDVHIPLYHLSKMGLNPKEVTKEMNLVNRGGQEFVSLKELLGYDQNTGKINNTEFYENYKSKMSIPVTEQQTFIDMDGIYDYRWPYFDFSQGNPNAENLCKDVLRGIAETFKASGVEYSELAHTSLSTGNCRVFEWIDKYMPDIEKETGVKLRFLCGLVRSQNHERIANGVMNIVNVAKSPYVVGSDFLGHENNSTKDFAQGLEALASYAMLQDPSFTIRVHSGESSVFKDNTLQVLQIIQATKDKLEKQTGKTLPMPNIRIGHGLNGLTDELMEMCRKMNVTIEINMTSNLSLNNINSLDSVPIKKYMDYGINVVLGSDGTGIYQTTAKQETLLARQAGLTQEDIYKMIDFEEELIAKKQQAFDKKMDSYNKAKAEQIEKLKMFGSEPTADAVLLPILKFGSKAIDLELAKQLDEGNIAFNMREYAIKKECEAKRIAFEENEIKNLTDGKKPIFVFGYLDDELKALPPEQKKDLIQKLAVIAASATKDNYFVTSATNSGMSRLFNQILKKVQGDKIKSIGLTSLNRAGKDSISQVDGVIWNSENDTSFGFAQIATKKCLQENGKIICIGGDTYVSDIIQVAHNAGANIALDTTLPGASQDKAKMYHETKEFDYLSNVTDYKNAISSMQENSNSTPAITETQINEILESLKSKPKENVNMEDKLHDRN